MAPIKITRENFGQLRHIADAAYKARRGEAPPSAAVDYIDRLNAWKERYGYDYPADRRAAVRLWRRIGLTGDPPADDRDLINQIEGFLDGRRTEVKQRKPTADQEAVYIGDKKCQVDNDPPITLEEGEDTVLVALIELGGSASKSQLSVHSGRSDAHKVLKRIAEKHATLAAHITLPGKRGAGGYRTTIHVKD